jgi:MFS family permease
MPKWFIPQVTRDTLQFFSQPISGLLREQTNMLLLTVAIMESAFSSSVICIPLYFYGLEKLDSSVGYHMTLMLTIYYIVTLTTSSFFGSLSDRFGRRPLLIIGTAIGGISFIAFPAVYETYLESITPFIILLGSSIIKGLSSAMISGPIMAMFVDLSPEGNHGATMGKFYLARSGGGASGYLIGGLTWDLFYEYSFLIFSFVLLVSCLLYAFKLYEPKHKISVSKEIEAVNIESDDDLEINPFKALLDSLKSKQFRNFGIALLAYSCLLGAGATYASAIIQEATAERLPASFIGVVALCGAIIYGSVQPLLGRLSDEYGRKPFLVIGVFGISLLMVIFTTIIKLNPTELVSFILNAFSITDSKELEFVRIESNNNEVVWKLAFTVPCSPYIYSDNYYFIAFVFRLFWSSIFGIHC